MIVHVLRKPLIGTVAANALAHGAGALNIDQCRVTTSDTIDQSGEKVTISRGKIAEGYDRPNRTMYRTDKPKERSGPAAPLGRWPANLVHDGSDEVVETFPESNRWFSDGKGKDGPIFDTHRGSGVGGGDSGSASRFFQQVLEPKAPQKSPPLLRTPSPTDKTLLD